ncbi:hypothetical protein QBC34DRAFT_404765 [Podospora aff. communis PSN243]|uniref:Uncharacterized protein n=1 Tax=Podospora aff. communis PSN243 TaxID=3040156 RepID=A0AAV9GLH3_9PEZI|nr:hypothetical protein QBC34DRAFT_404765 [Podospora aff. communis PSN243]
MERDASEKLVINSASRRRSLFSSRPRSAGSSTPNSPGGASQQPPATFGSSTVITSDSKLGSSANTKIPRLASTRPSIPRRPVSTSDAWQMALDEEQKEAAQGSPSPAPRSWRRPAVSDGKLQKARAPVRRRTTKPGEMRREDTASSVESPGTPIRKSDVSESDFDEKLRQHALEQGSSEDLSQRGSGLFSKSRLGIKISETAKELVRKTSRNSLEAESPSRAGRSPRDSWISRRLSARKSGSDQSLQGTSGSQQGALGPSEEQRPSAGASMERPGTVPPDYRSPEKSFAWQADEDFTAGDLQVSTSPPVAIGRSNTKLDELKALEAAVGETASQSPPLVKRNTKLDEIRALEKETASRFTTELPQPIENDNSTRELGLENGSKSPPSWQPATTTTKRDELRAREMETLSKRALATARLDEIRERHASESRSPSPDIVRKASKEPLKSLAPGGDGSGVGEKKSDVAIAAAANSKPPIDEAVILENSSSEKDSREKLVEVPSEGFGQDSAPAALEARRDSQDMVRKLAAATNSPPVVAVDINSIRDRLGRDASRQKKADAAKGGVRPTVGFVGLKREPSAESLSDKRSSVAHSDVDPTERIIGEMSLFAPLENHSEKGSLRASSPSPPLELEDVEETPRPAKPDPLTQPTPRVTGAFVDTPVTVKVDRHGDAPIATVPTFNLERDAAAASGSGAPSNTDETNPLARGRNTGGSAQNLVGLAAKSGRPSGRPASVPGRRRSRSQQRARRPLLNSARPPTVKDDLLAIQKANHFDDSTLDDLADMLGKQEKHDDESGPQGIKSEPDADPSETQKSQREIELEAYVKISKSLETGLQGIRTARLGIERLEDKVAHIKPKGPETPATHPAHPTANHPCADCNSGHSPMDSSFTYIQLPFPRLWHGHPRFRLTLTGLIFFLLSLWYIAESSMCAVYCKPQVCYSGQPCDWSPDDPQWGYSIPVKLDQWLTGGMGRAFAARTQPELSDWIADVWDAATGTDITRIDTSRLTREQKRQHRRRLLRRAKPSPARPEDKAKLEAWSAARAAKERVSATREMGFVAEEDESMASDERI